MADTLEVAVEVDTRDSVSAGQRLAASLESVSDALRGVGQVAQSNMLEGMIADFSGVRAQAQAATQSVNQFRSALTQASRVQLVSGMAGSGLSAYSRQIADLQSTIAGRTASAGGTGRSGFTREEESSLRIQKEMVRLANEEYAARSRNVTVFRAFREQAQAAQRDAKELLATVKQMNQAQVTGLAGSIGPNKGTPLPTAQTSAFNALPANFAARDNLGVQLAAQRDLIAALELEEEKMYRVANARYAYFAAGAAIAAGSAAIIAANVGVIATAAEYESAFAAIQRTSQSTAEQMGPLRQEFLALSAGMATSFQELAQIGELAGQLNVPVDQLTNFTEIAGQMAATTDVTAEAAATAFGRLDGLIPSVQGNYEGLGSAILNVGVNSVATESDIVSVATNIAAVGAQAGFSGAEVIGFAGAMRSIGINPYLARGGLTRIFGQISNAIAEGGTALEEFATLSGVSANEFEAAWRGDAAGTFQNLLEGMEGARQSGEDLYQTFTRLGIVNSQDQQVLAVMSQNYDQVAAAVAYANEGFAEGTQLQEAYDIQANTVNGRLQILQNSFGALIATMGQLSSGPIMGLFEGITTIMNGLRAAIENNPVAAQFIAIAGAGSALIGVVGAAVGAFALFRGSMFAITQATQTQRLEMAREKAAFLENRLATDQVTASKTRLTAALYAVSGAFARAQFAANQNASTLVGVNAQTGAFGRGLAGVLGILGGPWGIALAGATVGVTLLTGAIEGSQAQVDEWAASLSAGATAADLFALANEGWDGLWNDMDFDVEGYTGDFNALTAAAAQFNSTSVNSNMALSALAAQFGVAEQDISRFAYGLDQIDSNLATMAPETAAAGFVGFADSMNLGETEAANLLYSMEDLRDTLLTAGIEAGAWSAAQRDSVTATELLTFANSGLATSAADSADAMLLGAGMADELGDAMSSAATDAQALQQMLAGELSIPNAFNAAAEAAYNMGTAIANSGGAFNILDASGQGALANLMSSVSTAIVAGEAMGLNAAQSVSAVFTMLQAQGVDTAVLLAQLSGMGVKSIGGASLASIGQQMQSQNPALVAFRNALSQVGTAGRTAEVGGNRAARGARNAGRAAKEAAPEVRTLADYASDLGKVFDRSFELRFGTGQGSDKITGMWLEIQESIDEANEAMRDAQAEIRGVNAEIASLTADRAILEYFESMAVAYGDVLRQGDIGGEIGKINEKIAAEQDKAAKASLDMTAAQAELDKGLTGNSRSAIQNRETVLNLVSGYQDYLQVLASSGADQATLNAEAARLRAEFIQQATQLGFNQTELAKYADAFDDVTVAINGVPRNITVSADTYPGRLALAEFAAQATQRGREAGSNAAGGFGGGFNAGSLGSSLGNGLYNSIVAALAAAGADGGTAAARNYKTYWNRQTQNYQRRDETTGQWVRTDLNIYRGGGYTGSQYGVNEIAGQVHGQEYVINAANTRRLGLPFLNALNSGQTPIPGATQAVMPSSANQRGIQVVELSAYDRQLLAEAGNVQLSIGNRDIAQANKVAAINMQSRGGN